MTPEILARREVAAIASGGTSDEAIYHAMLRAAGDRGVRGCALDYGAGVGNLARRLLASVAFERVVACDLMPRPSGLPEVVEWVAGDLNEPVALPSATFDVVFAAEVIEHLENPRAVAREWHRLLRPGGSLFASTPNNESWRALGALLLRGHYVAFSGSCYPAHITALLRSDLERVLAEAGFVGTSFVFTDVGGIPKIPRFAWQQISPRLFRGRRYSDNVVAIARKPG